MSEIVDTAASSQSNEDDKPIGEVDMQDEAGPETNVDKPRHRRNRSSVDEVLSENKEEAESLGIQVHTDSGSKTENNEEGGSKAGEDSSSSPLGNLPPLKVASSASKEGEPQSALPENEEEEQTRRLFGSAWSRESF